MADNIFYDKLCNKADGVSHKEIIPLLDKMKNINVEQLRKVVDFTFRQYSYWETEYAFSPINNPNTLAKNESQEWETISGTFRDLLVETAPEVGNLISKQQDYILIKCLIQRRMDYNEKKPIEKALTSIMSNTSIFLKNIGLKSLGLKLYKNSLYPEGTIGRIT